MRLVSSPLIPTSPGTLPGQTSITIGSPAEAERVANVTRYNAAASRVRVLMGFWRVAGGAVGRSRLRSSRRSPGACHLINPGRETLVLCVRGERPGASVGTGHVLS